MSTKALKTQLLAAIAMVLVASIALGSSTYAWFASNNKVTATNMQVTATTSESLVITNDTLPSATTGTITVASSDTTATALIPATHDSTWATHVTGLKYNTNPNIVSASTGLAEAGKGELSFADAANVAGGATYYKDYTVYIAASGGEMTDQDITVKIDTPTVLTTLPGATSVDFYSKTVTTTGALTPADDTFKGTLNLAGLNPTTNDGTATKTELTISDVTIPKAGSSSAIAVMMRVYVDGALKKNDNTTFVKNISVAEVAGQTVGVSFTATSHA